MRFEPGTTGSGRAILRREYVLEDAAARQQASPPSSPSSSTRWTCWKGGFRDVDGRRRGPVAPRRETPPATIGARRARGRARRRRKTKRRERIRTGAAIRIWRRTTPSARSMTSRAKTPDDRGARIRERSGVGGDGRVGRAAAFAEKERVAEDRDAAPHAGRWTPFDATCACLHSAWPRALPVFVAAAARLRPEEDEDAAGTFAPRGVGTPRVGTPSSRARASRAVRHRPGRGDGRRRVSGGARGVVGGGGATARRRVDASLAPSGRRGRRAGCRWRLGTPIGTLVTSGALVTRANDATRVEARRASSPRGVRGGGRRGLPRRRSRLRRARRRVSPRRASRRFARRRGHRFETQRTRE